MKTYKDIREVQSNEPIAYNSDLVEKVASLLHDQWMDMARGLIKKGEISQETQDRWARECFMPYAKLTERMKEIDRVFARRIVNHLEIKGYATK